MSIKWLSNIDTRRGRGLQAYLQMWIWEEGDCKHTWGCEFGRRETASISGDVNLGGGEELQAYLGMWIWEEGYCKHVGSVIYITFWRIATIYLIVSFRFDSKLVSISLNLACTLAQQLCHTYNTPVFLHKNTTHVLQVLHNWPCIVPCHSWFYTSWLLHRGHGSIEVMTLLYR